MGKRLDLLKEEIHKYGCVIIYGAGNNAAPLVNYFDESEEFRNIDLHVAVTRPKINEVFRGHKVEKINELTNLRYSALVIVAVFQDYFYDIDNKLNELGFEHYMHLEEWFVDEAYYENIREQPIDHRKILVENFHGLGYGDSPKYIVNEILKRRENLDIVWIIKPGLKVEVPKGVRTVEIYSSQFFFEIYTAAVWISNVRKYQCVKKRIGQFYVQTWHGFTLKKIEKDAEEISHGISSPYFDAGKRDSKMIDILISNSSFLTKVLKKGFWYDGLILECGTPRNDILFHSNTILAEQIKLKYGLDKNTNILLYAPTFRNSYKDNPLDVDILAALDCLERKTGAKWAGLIRLHPNIAGKAEQFSYNERVINVTAYPDVMELLAVTDALITDYSSIMFDFMIKKKPIFLYSKDLERYTNDDRGFYFDYNSLPFPIAVTNEELVRNIEAFDTDTYIEELEKFIKKMGFRDNGDASKIIADKILLHLA